MIVALCSLAFAAPRDLHQERFEAARAAETDGRFDDAVADCRQAVAAAPTGPRTPNCQRRIAFLEARRDLDGTFRTWSALESVRRRWRTDDQGVLAAEVDALRPSALAVRAEVAIWIARDALSRRDDPAAALAATDLVYADSAAFVAENALWRQVVELRAVSLARLGQVDAAREVEAAVKFEAPGAERPTAVDQVVLARRREVLAWFSWASVLLFGSAGLPLAVRGLRLRPVPRGLVPVGVAGIGTWLVATGWDSSAAVGVPRMIAGLAGVHIVSLGALLALRERPRVQWAMRLAAALASVAVGYLALWSTGTLPWVGL